MNTQRNTLVLLFSLLFFIGFAQRGEVRDAEDEVEDGNYQEAFKYLEQAKAEGILEDKEKWQARYYLTMGNAYLGAENGVGRSYENLKKAAESFKKSLTIEDEDEPKEGLTKVRTALVQNAVNDQKKQKYEAAAKQLYKSYELSKKRDTMYLYYAASNLVQGKAYDKAVKYYKELMDMNFDGSRTEYYATYKSSGEQERFETKDFRDLSIKSGEYENPVEKISKSKRPEIAKNIALIYIQEGKKEKALNAVDEALAENKNDPALLQAKADIYYEMDDIEKYDEIMKKIVEQRPDDPNLYYNLGVASEKNDKAEDAKKYYKKAIELNPEFVNAYINLSTAILSEEKEIVKQMNELGMSDADQKKYDKLKEKKKKFYEEALPYLKKAIELEPNNLGAIQTLMNIHYQLGNDKKAQNLKTKLDKLQAGN
jgi:tetratricopeptide (TPR) repeat protein